VTEELKNQVADVTQALAAGAPQRVGKFRFYFGDQRWEWSEQVQQIHGYEPGTVTPTTELVLSHKHPDDRGQVAARIEDILSTHKAFSTRHRIIDTGGAEHYVVVVADQLCDEGGEVIGTHGFYIDVTSLSEEIREDVRTAEMTEFTQNRAAIERAKGMLMLIYGLDEDAAFDLLRWLSQESNTKLRLLAHQIVKDFRQAGHSAIQSMTLLDQLLITAHMRIADGQPPSNASIDRADSGHR
jgi:PAS domain S-box-containing protein